MIAHERFTVSPNKIIWGILLRQHYPRACAVCRSERDVSASDTLGRLGCTVCLEGARRNHELGGEG